jgi:hypothetical protein
MTSYNSCIHALRDLFLLNEGHSGPNCRITKISRDVSHLENGIGYCFVEVTCDGGEQYGIQAFGDEAVELRKEALKLNQFLGRKNEVGGGEAMEFVVS